MTTRKPEPTTDDELINPRRPLEVRMMMNVEAKGPLEAVDGCIKRIVTYGFLNMVYRVRDPQTEEVWIVRDNQVMTVEEFLAQMKDLEPEYGAGDGAEG
jgi:hypothetical protein